MAKSMRDRIREEAQKATTEGASYLKLPGKVPFFQPKDEEYELDFLPYENNTTPHPKGYEKGELIAYVRFKIHNGIGAEDNKYICPTSIGKKCPICEERAKLAKNSKTDPDLLKALAPKDRMLFQVIDLNEEKKGVQLFEYSYHLFGKRLLGDIDKTENSSGSRRRSTPHAGFADLEEGQTLFVTFIEKKIGNNNKSSTKFYEADRIDAEERKPYGDEILDETIDLFDCLKVLPYDQLEAIFLEMDPEDQGSNRKREKEDDDDKGHDRGSRRGGREEGESRSSRRGSKEDEGEGRSSRRSRGEESGKEEKEDSGRSSRRGRGSEEKEEKEDSGRSSRRSRGGDDEGGKEEKGEGRSSRSRGNKEEKEEKEDSGRSSRRSRGKEEEEEKGKGKEEAPERSRRQRGGDDAGEERCPFAKKGGKFGEKCDLEDCCYDCKEDLWNECREATDKFNEK